MKDWAQRRESLFVRATRYNLWSLVIRLVITRPVHATCFPFRVSRGAVEFRNFCLSIGLLVDFISFLFFFLPRVGSKQNFEGSMVFEDFFFTRQFFFRKFFFFLRVINSLNFQL